MFEKENTYSENIPVVEKLPPVTEMNGDSIKMLSEAAMILSVVISDISGRTQEETTGDRNPPHCLMEQAALISSIAMDVARRAKEIKSMITA